MLILELKNMNKFTLENRPNFKQDQLVYVDCTCFGDPNLPKFKSGRIVGQAIVGLLDLWLVDFGEKFSETYPYTVVAVQHTFFWKPVQEKIVDKSQS